jgi:hypothetical protein
MLFEPRDFGAQPLDLCLMLLALLPDVGILRRCPIAASLLGEEIRAQTLVIGAQLFDLLNCVANDVATSGPVVQDEREFV